MALKNGKSPVYNNLDAELFKADPGVAPFSDHCSQLCGKEKEYLTTNVRGVIVKIPKKRALSTCNHRREITLLSVTSKTLVKIIIRRMSDAVDPVLRNE
jgi:hypothetical protein